MSQLLSSATDAVALPAYKGFLSRIPRWFLAIIAAFTPTLATFGIISGILQRNFFDFRPALWNDQTYYWHQILTFSHAGFNGGYYMFYERLPRLSFFHFGASGFLYPALYGTAARVVGWEPYTGILLNMALIAISVLVLIHFAQFDRLQIVLTALLLVAIAPVLLYVPTISQESFHQAAALILGALFFHLFNRNGNVSRRFVVIGILFFILISLIRFSWIILIVPFLLFSQGKWTWRKSGLACVASVVIALGILVVFQLTSAPGNNSIFARIGAVGSDPLTGLKVVWDYFTENLNYIFTVPDFRQFHIEFAQFFILLFGLLLSSRLFSRNDWSIAPKQFYFHIYNLCSILGASLILYVNVGFFRVLAPHLILSGILLIGFKGFRYVNTVIIIGLLGMGMFLADYREWSGNFSQYAPVQIETIDKSFAQYMRYDPQATNPWCNTLLMNLKFLNLNATFVPAGMGISFFFDPVTQDSPLKSLYVLLDDYSYAVLRQRANLSLLGSISSGNLYRNLDADCN